MRLVANAATPFRVRINAAWRARDWEGLAELLASDYRFSDRRRMVQVELDREGWVEMTRRLGAMSSARVETEELATRGNRLALWRVRIDVADEDVGPSCVEHLNLHEVNATGDHLIGGARFDADDIDVAYAELDARYEAGEGAAHPAHTVIMRAFAAAVASRDWDPVVALCAPTFVEHDHRALAVLGTTRGAAAWAENFRTLTELAPDTVYRVDHFRSAARGSAPWGRGRHATAAAGIPLIAVIELRRARAAWCGPISTIWSRPTRRAVAALAASIGSAALHQRRDRDGGPVIACDGRARLAASRGSSRTDFHMSDRRREVQLDLDRDQYVAFTARVADGRAVRGSLRAAGHAGEAARAGATSHLSVARLTSTSARRDQRRTARS